MYIYIFKKRNITCIEVKRLYKIPIQDWNAPLTHIDSRGYSTWYCTGVLKVSQNWDWLRGEPLHWTAYSDIKTDKHPERQK